MVFRELTREEAATLPDEAFTLGVPEKNDRIVGLIDEETGRIYASFILMYMLHIESWWQDPAIRGADKFAIKEGLLRELKFFVAKQGEDGWLSVAARPGVAKMHAKLGGKQVPGVLTHFDALDVIFKE